MITSRSALCMCAATAMLAACAGQQPPTGAPVRQAVSGNAQSLGHSGSWMLPEAQHEDLLYIGGAMTTSAVVFVYKYPGLTLVGTLELGDAPEGLCSDAHGDVYVTEQGNYTGQFIEFKHGESKPERTIPTTPYQPNSCSVAPKSGDLAVATNGTDGSHGPALLVYHKAKGSPTIYKPSTMYQAFSTAYGARDETFLMGLKTCRSYYDRCDDVNVLPPRGSVLRSLRVPGVHQHSPGEDLGWDGTYLVVLKGDLVRYQVQRKKVTKIGVVLKTGGFGYQFCLVPKYGQVLVSGGGVEIYDYPSGQYVGAFYVERAYGMAYSLAQSS
jgi:hypothetical protein